MICKTVSFNYSLIPYTTNYSLTHNSNINQETNEVKKVHYGLTPQWFRHLNKKSESTFPFFSKSGSLGWKHLELLMIWSQNDLQDIIAGNFCGVFISAILRFLSATAELKTAEYFPLLFYLWPSIRRRRHDLGQYLICISSIII